MLLQAQCDYTNVLAHEYERWKTPEARGQPDQIETILSFHEAIAESVNQVADRYRTLQPLVVAAGDAVGGLNLEGRASEPSQWKRLPWRRH